MPLRRPGRLRAFDYLGLHRYLLTLCTHERRPLFRDERTVAAVLMQFRLTAAVEGFALVAYTFMPDHLHLLVEGERESCDLRLFVARAKQRTGFDYARRFGGHLWQDGYHDRVLRSDEETMTAARYVLANPVRAGLAERFGEYPYAGSDRYTVDEMIVSLADVGHG